MNVTVVIILIVMIAHLMKNILIINTREILRSPIMPIVLMRITERAAVKKNRVIKGTPRHRGLTLNISKAVKRWMTFHLDIRSCVLYIILIRETETQIHI